MLIPHVNIHSTVSIIIIHYILAPCVFVTLTLSGFGDQEHIMNRSISGEDGLKLKNHLFNMGRGEGETCAIKVKSELCYLFKLLGLLQ